MLINKRRLSASAFIKVVVNEYARLPLNPIASWSIYEAAINFNLPACKAVCAGRWVGYTVQRHQMADISRANTYHNLRWCSWNSKALLSHASWRHALGFMQPREIKRQSLGGGGGGKNWVLSYFDSVGLCVFVRGRSKRAKKCARR